MRRLTYDHGFGRRLFLSRLAAGSSACGVLQPLWQAWAAGNPARAYPDELLSLEAYTKGRISEGGVIDASNVALVRDLLDPVRYTQILEMGRRLHVAATTTDPMRLGPWEYLEATARNHGQARFDIRGNVVTADGNPWIGGIPFAIHPPRYSCLQG